MPNNTPDNLGTRPTSAGLALLAKAIAGKQLVFTRGAFGDSYRNGQFVDPTIAEQTALTALINERMSLPIADISAHDGNAKVELLVKNANVNQTFQVREVGLFARDPDTNAEVLYCYIHYGDFGFIIPANSTTVIIEFFYQLTTAVGAAQDVTAIIDRTSLYLTLNKFMEHVNATDPHPNVPPYELPTGSKTVKGGFKVGANLYVTNDSLNAADSYVLPTGSKTVKGGFKVGANLYVTNDSLNAANAYDDAPLVARVTKLEEAVIGTEISETLAGTDTWRGSTTAQTDTLTMSANSADYNLYSDATMNNGFITIA